MNIDSSSSTSAVTRPSLLTRAFHRLMALIPLPSGWDVEIHERPLRPGELEEMRAGITPPEDGATGA